MRRTTQWAVFTSMNQKPAWRLLYEPADGAHSVDEDAHAADNAETESRSRTAPDTRRDRVDFM
jgi:hypothetical protein